MDLNQVRSRLLEQREMVCEELKGLEAGLSISMEEETAEEVYDQHIGDVGTPTLNREMDVSLEDNARSLLVQIDRAVSKLEEGTYGICDNCGRPIGEGRLEAAPYATLCIDCQRASEREHRTG